MSTTQNHGHGYDHNHAHGLGTNPSHHAQPAPTGGRLIRYARLYDRLVWLMAQGQTRALRALPLDLAGLKAGEHVLDVGCGTGDMSLAAARRVGSTGSVQGIDASPEMIHEAGRKAQRAGLTPYVHFDVQPVEQMTFPDASFDVVLSSLMLHHLPGDLKQRALAEIRRVLRPGGRLVIVDLQPMTRRPRPWEPGWLILRRHKMDRASPSQVSESQQALAGLLQQSGFTSVEVGTTRYPWLGYARGIAPTNVQAGTPSALAVQ